MYIVEAFRTLKEAEDFIEKAYKPDELKIKEQDKIYYVYNIKYIETYDYIEQHPPITKIFGIEIQLNWLRIKHIISCVYSKGGGQVILEDKKSFVKYKERI